MNKMKQTAVEWLRSTIKNMILNGADLGDDYPALLQHLEQAKAMEKEQKDKQYARGFKDGQNHIKIIYNL